MSGSLSSEMSGSERRMKEQESVVWWLVAGGELRGQ